MNGEKKCGWLCCFNCWSWSSGRKIGETTTESAKGDGEEIMNEEEAEQKMKREKNAVVRNDRISDTNNNNQPCRNGEEKPADGSRASRRPPPKNGAYEFFSFATEKMESKREREGWKKRRRKRRIWPIGWMGDGRNKMVRKRKKRA